MHDIYMLHHCGPNPTTHLALRFVCPGNPGEGVCCAQALGSVAGAQDCSTPALSAPLAVLPARPPARLATRSPAASSKCAARAGRSCRPSHGPAQTSSQARRCHTCGHAASPSGPPRRRPPLPSSRLARPAPYSCRRPRAQAAASTPLSHSRSRSARLPHSSCCSATACAATGRSSCLCVPAALGTPRWLSTALSLPACPASDLAATPTSGAPRTHPVRLDGACAHASLSGGAF